MNSEAAKEESLLENLSIARSLGIRDSMQPDAMRWIKAIASRPQHPARLLIESVNPEAFGPRRVSSVERTPLSSSVVEHWQRAQQPKIKNAIAVTSLSTRAKHQERQPVCLNSWKRFGFDIAVVETKEAIEKLRPLYPQVSYWIDTDEVTTDYPGSETIKINALFSVAEAMNTTIVIINSDIELIGDQGVVLQAIEKSDSVVTIGIRQNYATHPSDSSPELFGLDLFVISPRAARSFPKMPLGIGKPVWDYWIPLHFKAIALEGWTLSYIHDPIIFHKSHDVFWDGEDINKGGKWLFDRYKTFNIRTDNHMCRNFRRLLTHGGPPAGKVVWDPNWNELTPTSNFLLITTAIGEQAQEVFSYTRESIEAYAWRIGVELIVLTGATQPWWGLEKFRVGRYATYYDRVCYIDADIVISEDAPNIFDVVPVDKVGARNDAGLHSQTPVWREDEFPLLKESYPDLVSYDTLFSSAVLVASRDLRSLWEPPLQPIEPTWNAEQLWFEQSIHRLGYFELDAKWNYQAWMKGFDLNWRDAYFVHLCGMVQADKIKWLKSNGNKSR